MRVKSTGLIPVRSTIWGISLVVKTIRRWFDSNKKLHVWKVGRVWFIASVLKTEEQKCSMSSNLILSSSRCTNDTIATMCNATASHHRMGYLRVSHSDGIHRVDLGIPRTHA